MTEPLNFADHPKSIGEIKSEREQDGSLWTPRDALIDVLREIDAGIIKPEALVLAFKYRDDKGTMFGFRQSGPDLYTSLGLCQRLIFRLQERD